MPKCWWTVEMDESNWEYGARRIKAPAARRTNGDIEQRKMIKLRIIRGAALRRAEKVRKEARNEWVLR